MKLWALVCVLGCLSWATPGAAQRYVFSGAPVGDVYPPTNCTAATCPTYVAGVTQPSGWVSVDSQIIQTTPPTTALARVTGFRFSDGVIVYDSSDPQTRLTRFNVLTDATGVPQTITVSVTRWNTATPAADGSENARFSSFEISWRVSSGRDYFIYTNSLCTALAGTVPESCVSSTADSSFGSARRLETNIATFVFEPLVAIPTLSEWMMLVMAALLALTAVVMVRRRNSAEV